MILDDMFLGSGADAQNIAEIRKFGITRILNMSKEVPNYFEHSLDLQYKRIAVCCRQHTISCMLPMLWWCNVAQPGDRSRTGCWGGPTVCGLPMPHTCVAGARPMLLTRRNVRPAAGPLHAASRQILY